MLGNIFNWVTNPVDSTVFALIIFAVGWATKKWLLPLLNTEARKKLAEYILVIADEVTDQLVAKYPEKEIWRYLDRAVDKIMKVCGIKEETAKRAIEAAMARKGIKRPE